MKAPWRLPADSWPAPAPGRRPKQRRVGMVFQDYALFPHLTVGAEHRLRAPSPRASATRVPELLGDRRARRARAAVSARAVRWSAAARRGRARARSRAGARAARRAVVERRPVPARDVARRGHGDRPAARRDRGSGHARPRGGVLARRPDRAHAATVPSSRREVAGGALLRAGDALGGRVRRRRQRPLRPAS